MYILIPVIFLFLFFPVTISINLNSKLKDKKIELEPMANMQNSISIKLFKFIPVYKYKLFSSKKKATKTKRKSKGLTIAKVAFKTLRIDSLYLSFGINTYNYIINSYLNAVINTTICMYVNLNEKKFNFNNLYYQIYISEKPLVINLEADISASLVKIIYVIIKEKIEERKKDKNSYSKVNKKVNKNKVSCTY